MRSLHDDHSGTALAWRFDEESTEILRAPENFGFRNFWLSGLELCAQILHSSSVSKLDMFRSQWSCFLTA